MTYISIVVLYNYGHKTVIGDIMCLICLELNKGFITTKEARRNLSESVIGIELQNDEQDHVVEVLALINSVENEQNETSSQ